MTDETAQLLATAIHLRDLAAEGLTRLLKASHAFIEIPDPMAASMKDLAATYVHEQRIINKIISEDTDD